MRKCRPTFRFDTYRSKTTFYGVNSRLHPTGCWTTLYMPMMSGEKAYRHRAIQHEFIVTSVWSLSVFREMPTPHWFVDFKASLAECTTLVDSSNAGSVWRPAQGCSRSVQNSEGGVRGPSPALPTEAGSGGITTGTFLQLYFAVSEFKYIFGTSNVVSGKGFRREPLLKLPVTGIRGSWTEIIIEIICTAAC